LRTIQFLISFSCILWAQSLYSQDVFELTYRFKNDSTQTIYKGLLFRSANDTGFLRLTAINKNTKKRVLYDFSISLNAYDMVKRPLDGGLMLGDSTYGAYWYCWSENYSIKEGTEVSDFDYLRFWFKWNRDTKMKEPCLQTPFSVDGRSLGFTDEPVVASTTDSAGNQVGRLEETGILSYKIVKNISFTKVYLQEFFITSELFYDGAYSKKQVLTARNNIKPVLYLVSVINSKDDVIGANCINDGKKISSYFKRVTTFLGIPFTEKRVEGNNLTVNGVKTAIKSIYPGKDDIVVFYYSGHGFSYSNDDNNPFPQLALWYGDAPNRTAVRASSINLEEVYNLIKAKKARLNLVMGDCCNNLFKLRRQAIYDTVKSMYPPGYFYMNKRTAIALFLQSTASVMIGAAEKGQMANVSTSYDSFFTTAMINSIRLGLKTTGPNPQWTNIIQNAGVQTTSIALDYKEEQRIIFRVCNSKSPSPCVEVLGNKMVKASSK